MEPPTVVRKPKLKADSEQNHRQIVQTETGETVKTSEKDAYLGAKNQKVDRQTVSRDHTTVIGHQGPAKTSSESKKRESSSAEKKVAGTPAMPALGNLGLAVLPKTANSAKPEEDRPWAEQGASPQDYVKGVRESDKTALNTKEFVFYSYYQRIRSQLDRAWLPILRQNLVRFYRTGRQLASDMDHSTRVLVFLSPSGEVVRVKVMQESGTEDLDDAAVKAFNQAGPFPNPPKGIVDINGEIQIPWEFILRT